MRSIDRRSGFTLAEALIATVVLAASVVGVSMTLSAADRQKDVMVQTCVAFNLAHQLMEEISAQPFLGPDGIVHSGPSGSMTSRSMYTSVGNYNGYTDSTNSMTTIDGAALSFGLGNANYSRSVSVQFMTSPTGPVAASGNYALVTVTVTSPTMPNAQVSRLFTNMKQTW